MESTSSIISPEKKMSELPMYKLTMQQILDSFMDSLYIVNAYIHQDYGRLTGIRRYHRQKVLSERYVYIAKAEELPAIQSVESVGSLICIGKVSDYYKQDLFSIIEFPEHVNEEKLFEHLQELFEYNLEWSISLQTSLSTNNDLDPLLELACDYFSNPVFVHDPEFFILSSPRTVTGMTQWEYDPQTELLRAPQSLIYDFKVDSEYQETLKTTGPNMFSANTTGYRIMYQNIWDEFGKYEGRICVDELQSSIMPGQYHALDYFTSVMHLALSRSSLESSDSTRPFVRFLTRVLDNQFTPGDSEIWLPQAGWNINDQFICVNMLIPQEDANMRSVIQTCHYIEASLPGCYAFQYKDNVCIVANLTVGKMSSDEFLSRLSPITREGLFKTGVSTQYNDFLATPHYNRQARISLEYGLRDRESMFWNYRFDTYAVPYIIDQITSELSADQLVHHGLFKLRNYDRKNETDFFETLRVYLLNERNAKATAEALYIHRSTLFYRLNKINAITGANLDDPDTRLYLLLSFQLLK